MDSFCIADEEYDGEAFQALTLLGFLHQVKDIKAGPVEKIIRRREYLANGKLYIRDCRSLDSHQTVLSGDSVVKAENCGKWRHGTGDRD